MLFTVPVKLISYVPFRSASDANEQHDAEIDSARVAAEQDGLKNTDDTLQYIDSEFHFSFSL